MIQLLIALTLIFSLSPFLTQKIYTKTTSETVINGELIACCKCGCREIRHVHLVGKIMVAFCAKCFKSQEK
jgi:hypothetical protein